MAKRPRVAGDFTNALAATNGSKPHIRPPFDLPKDTNGRAPPIPEDGRLERDQLHPRVVEELGKQMYSGPKPTRRLMRGGQC